MVISVLLSDGSRALVRPLAEGESPRVQEVFDGLSDESRRLRFAGAKPQLTARDLEVLTAVDHEDHEAFVAVEAVTGRAVGEARVVRDTADPRVGEVAFAIADAWQGRCLGAHLADILARRARELGMSRLRADVSAGNRPSTALMRRMGRVVARRYDGGSLELEVALD